MADYVLARKSRNIASNAVHVFLNILLGTFAVVLTVFSQSPVFGIILVLMSKWRVLAVRRRYLWTNIKANLVDLIVGLSIVMLAYAVGQNSMVVDVILVVVYVVWLLFIKPMSSETAVLVQSLVAVFLGISAVAILTEPLNSVVAAALAFVIGYAASRHVLIQTNDKDFTLTTLVCGLIFAEVAILCHTWSIIYPLDFGIETGIRIPQAAIILTIFAFVYNYARQAMVRYQEDFRFKDILGPVIYAAVLVGILVLWFSYPKFNV